VADTVWVAAFTGATAILAGLVTTRGNARTARIQAEASAQAQRQVQVREIRRAAYLALIEQAHLIGQLYWQATSAFVQLSEEGAVLARIDELRDELRTAFDPLMRCARIVALEGPPPVAQAAQAVQDAAGEANRALWRFATGDPDARERFFARDRAFQHKLADFNRAAQLVMSAM
jgi:hypothetical protein